MGMDGSTLQLPEGATGMVISHCAIDGEEGLLDSGLGRCVLLLQLRPEV